MKKIAAIDIGTNSMRLLLCEYDGRSFASKHKDLIVTRMGQNVSAKGVICTEAIARNLEALNIFKAKADEFGAQELLAIATSAVRDAENKVEFLTLAYQRTGIEIKVISGEEEAELGITGVLNECKDVDENILVIDIGGGSTELVFGNPLGIKYSSSTNAGTVRMTEGFITSHPIADYEINDLNKNLNRLFEAPLEKLKSLDIQKAIAIGGTATTIAAIYHSLRIYDAQKVHNTVITFDYLQNLFEKLKAMTIEQRFEVAGLQKERSDVIPAGMAIMLHLMNSLELKSFISSENDNLEGAVIMLSK